MNKKLTSKCPKSTSKCSRSTSTCSKSTSKCRRSTSKCSRSTSKNRHQTTKEIETILSKLNIVKIYKRTHINDPSPKGEFGYNDCMGIQRNGLWQGIIGIGGNSKSTDGDIQSKITWGALNKKADHKRRLERELETGSKWRADIYTFEKFRLLDSKGPKITELEIPLISDRLFKKKARFYTINKNDKEWNEVIKIFRYLF